MRVLVGILLAAGFATAMYFATLAEARIECEVCLHLELERTESSAYDDFGTSVHSCIRTRERRAAVLNAQSMALRPGSKSRGQTRSA